MPHKNEVIHFTPEDRAFSPWRTVEFNFENHRPSWKNHDVPDGTGCLRFDVQERTADQGGNVLMLRADEQYRKADGRLTGKEVHLSLNEGWSRTLKRTENSIRRRIGSISGAV